MNPIAFQILTVFGGAIVLFFAFTWVKNLDDKICELLAEHDRRIDLQGEYNDFLFQLLLEKDTPDFEWEFWIGYAKEIDAKFQRLGIAQKSLERIVKETREQIPVSVRTEGGVR